MENLVAYSGKIERYIFEKDSFKIGILLTDNNEKMTFKGTLIGIEIDEDIILKGNIIVHQQYGEQLEVVKWERPIPRTKSKIVSYLSSSFIKGCGPIQAERIVEALGHDAIEMIKEQGEQALVDIKGIGKQKAKTISESIIETFELQEMVGDLSQYGIDPEYVIKFYKKHGAETLEILKRNPYELTKEKFITFPKADEIAGRMGMSPTSAYRIESGVEFVLNQHCNRYGHCYIYEKELIEATIEVLNQNTDEKITGNDIANAVYNLEGQTIIIEAHKVYPKALHTYEYYLSDQISKMLNVNSKKVKEKDIENEIQDFEKQKGFELAPEQKDGIRMALKENVSILTGSAGTGKTTVVEAILTIYQNLFPKGEISLSAPTGRASRKMEETTGHEAKTNHRLLGYQPEGGFEHDHENPLDYDFYIIDEMSMVDLHMSYSLLRAIKRRSKVLFIGDVYQLPSVNAGNVLKDLIETQSIPRTQLENVFRQKHGSQIVTTANKVKEGHSFEIDSSVGDMFFINQSTEEGIGDMIIKGTQRFLEKGYGISDILILTPMRKGEIGTHKLNERLQGVINPPTIDKRELKHGQRTFRVGDKVMQIVNDPDKAIYNGDIGIIESIEMEKDEDGKAQEVIKTHFQDNLVSHYKDEWKYLELGYAITIHKSQGGQAPIVLTPVAKSHYVMLKRNLIYTGMTRAEDKLILIGQREALNFAIQNNDSINRNTTLTERIEQEADILVQ